MNEAEIERFAIETATGQIRLSPPIFLNNHTGHSPADFSTVPPGGDGVYGFHEPAIADPMHAIDSTSRSGGVIFFGSQEHEHFMTLLRILEIARAYKPELETKKYWVYRKESDNPPQDGYLEQIRVVDRFGLRFMYGVLDEAGYDGFPEQSLTLPELLWSFMQEQRQRASNGDLKGRFGGDGHWAYEALRFGLMVENSYHHVYRMWSGAWLVTK